LVEMAVCNISGLLPTEHCPTVSEIFIAGTQPTIYDNIYQEFAVNQETERLATIYTPPELVENRVYRIYPEAAADWVRENEIEAPPTEFDTITDSGIEAQNARIVTPSNFDFVSGEVEVTGTANGDGFAFYRLAYFEGLTPNNLQSIVDNVEEPVTNDVLGVWDTSELSGLYTILLTVLREDGRFEETSVHVTIDNQPPEAEIVFPLPNQEIFTDEEWVLVQAQVSDDLSLDRVEFFVDNAEVPFAISTVPPFTEKWAIPGPGCHTFRVVAVDAAGNIGEETAVRVCLVERN